MPERLPALLALIYRLKALLTLAIVLIGCNHAIIAPLNIWYMTMKKITFQLADQEFNLLESYCEQTERGKTEVLRELIRSLKISSKSKDNCPSAEP